jgi:glycosyltransferase involved in cell wall biosynthesis
VVNRREVPDLLAAWGVPREKILVLPSAYIDLATFAPNATPKRYALGFVGRLVANKNPRYLAAIIESIAAANTGARFVIVGRGREGERLRRRLELRGILGRVEMRPWVDGPAELAALYRQMDALVCTSLSEGGPRVCLEAMACGVPVFTTPVGLMPDTVRDGVNGWILPWNQAAGAELVRRVLSDRPALQAAAREARAATESFDRDRVLGAYAAAYRGLAEENLA